VDLNQVTLPATDVARSAAFYRAMGFRQIVENLPSYARFECPVGTATFSLHQVPEAARGSGAIVYFECEDLDATIERLQDAGIVIDVGPENQSWLWREAYLRDPDENVICLFHAGMNRRHPPWRLPSPAQSRGEDEPYTITVEHVPSARDIEALRDGLTEHVMPVIPTAGFRPVGIFARDDTATIVGGVYALLNWSWLDIALLWVAEPLRGTGLGHRLLTMIEELGARHGCTHVHLDTFSFQARPFYERHGYEVFGTLDGYPGEHRRFYMRKTLGSPR
jgi:catechol 2,3-dioxygenase-like lactoylglutathione lyase family enzyme/GNAT superfamily N-acetyltransferase